MTPQETARMQAEVLIAFAEGKTIQCRRRTQVEWLNAPANPLWDWVTFNYRIKPAEPRKVKLEAWIDTSGELRRVLINESKEGWTRVPSLDLEYEATEYEVNE